MTRSARLALALAIVLAAPPLAAQQPTKPTNRNVDAEALFDQAVELMKAHRYGDACPKLEESQRMDPGIGTMLWLGECYEKTGRTASAWAQFRDAADMAARNVDDRAQVARERAARLAPSLVKLVLDVPPEARVAGLEIQRDGIVVGQPEWGTEIPIDPGDHVVHVAAPGYKAYETRFTLTEAGRSHHVAVPPLVREPEGATPAPPVPVPTTNGATPPTTSPTTTPTTTTTTTGGQKLDGARVGALVLGGVGVIGVGIGSYFGLTAMSHLHDADPHCNAANQCDAVGLAARHDAVSNATISTIAFAAGGAALVGAAVLWFAIPRARESDGAAVGVAVGPTGAILHGRW